MKTKNIIILFINEIPLIEKIVKNTPLKCGRYTCIDNALFQYTFMKDDLEKCKVEFTQAVLDQKFSAYITSMVLEAHKRVPAIRTSDPNESQQYGVKHEGKIEGLVSALVNKYSYYDYQTSTLSIFDFVATLLYRITKAHAFHNGNKRTAILSASMILNYCGYYITWSSHSEEYIKVWEDLMIKVAASDNCEDEIVNEIKEKILDSTWLKL